MGTDEGDAPVKGPEGTTVLDPERVTRLNPTGDPELTFDGRPRCNATSQQNKRRCERAKTPGTTVCATHGSRAPQVKRKAALRLLELVDPAIATLARTMTDNSAPHMARLRAAENVLDRAGVPRKVDVTDTEAAKALLVERLLAMKGMPAPEDPTPDIVLGTVVDETADQP